MKKRGAIIVLILLLVLPLSMAVSTCSDMGGILCSGFEYCEGTAVLSIDNPYRSSCCIGTCAVAQSLNCEENGALSCGTSTSLSISAKYKDISKPFLLYLLNPALPNQPYPKMWNFWYKFSIAVAAIILILNILLYFYHHISGSISQELEYQFKNTFKLMPLYGMILISLPYLATFILLFFDWVFTITTRLFIDNGSLLSLIHFYTQDYTTGFFNLLTLVTYFLLLFYLFIRYFLLILLLIFAPLLVALHSFILTQKIADEYISFFIRNLIATTAIVLFMAVSQPIIPEISGRTGTMMAFFTIVVFIASIWLYKRITGFNVGIPTLFRPWRVFKWPIK